MRLWYLYLRSRLTGWATAALLITGVAAWLALRETSYPEADVTMPLVVLPLLPAVVIGASTRSPFGDTELSVSYSLPSLRFGHLAGLLFIGGLILAGAASGWNPDAIGWELIRNLAGYTGLAFLGARLLGSGICWVVPLGYGVAALLLNPKSRLAWPSQFPNDGWSIAIAAAIVVIGLRAITSQRSLDRGDDFS